MWKWTLDEPHLLFKFPEFEVCWELQQLNFNEKILLHGITGSVWLKSPVISSSTKAIKQTAREGKSSRCLHTSHVTGLRISCESPCRWVQEDNNKERGHSFRFHKLTIWCSSIFEGRVSIPKELPGIYVSFPHQKNSGIRKGVTFWLCNDKTFCH